MKKVNVKINTVTPLYTGDAFGKMREIEPQSIIGSFRFWFETYLKASSMLNNYDYKSEEFNAKEYKKNILQFINEGMSLRDAEIMSINKQVPLPSLIFGCNGLKGLIEIDKINFESKDICNALDLPFAIYKKKSEQSFIEIKTKENHKEIRRKLREQQETKKYHFWYLLDKYFFGSFDVTFKIRDNDTIEKIFCPLLNFIEKYGFLGGKNNLGFGRVKFSIEGKSLDDFTDDIKNVVDENIKSIDDFYTLDKIGLCKATGNKREILNIIKELLSQKAQARTDFKKKYNDETLRHYIFGKEKSPVNATKIIPWINKTNDNNYEYGFISLIFLDERKLSQIKEKVNQNG